MNKTNPWCGLLTYEEGDNKHPFCGRECEVRELRELVDNNIVCTLYGKSGVGKSSLLKAGLFPTMRENGYLPVYVRLKELDVDNGYWSAIIKRIEAESKKHGYCCTFKSAIEKNDNAYDCFSKMNICTDNGNGDIIFPMIVFDQFEEALINDSGKNRLKIFLTELYDIIEPGLRDDIYNLRIIFSIREDDLYLFEDCIDNLNLYKFKESRYRLHQMSVDEAKDVILKPGKEFFEQSQENLYCEKLLSLAKTDIVGEERYDVLILSLVCSQLYDLSVQHKHNEITISDLNEFSQKKPFAEFYNSVCSLLSEEAINYLETHLVDAKGRRKIITKEEFTTNLPEYLLKSSNNKESQGHAILQTININNTIHVELIHDRLAKNIAEKRDARLIEKERNVKFNHIKCGIMAFLLLSLFVVVYRFVENNLSYSDNFKSDNFFNKSKEKSRTSVHVSFFNDSTFSFGNIIYHYIKDDSTLIFDVPKGMEEYVLYEAIDSFVVYQPTQRVILLGDPYRYKMQIDSTNRDSVQCKLLVPYSSMHRLLKNENINLREFKDISEMSMIDTWFLKAQWKFLTKYHCDDYKPVIKLASYIGLYILVFLLWPFTLYVLEKRRCNIDDKKLPFIPVFLYYCIPGLIIGLILEIIYPFKDSVSIFEYVRVLPIVLTLIIYILRRGEYLTDVQMWYIGKPFEERAFSQSRRSNRLEYNICLIVVALVVLFISKYSKSNVAIMTLVIISILILLHKGKMRSHDLGESGWCQWKIWRMIFEPGQPAPNKYGINPKNILPEVKNPYVFLGFVIMLGMIVLLYYIIKLFV